MKLLRLMSLVFGFILIFVDNGNALKCVMCASYAGLYSDINNQELISIDPSNDLVAAITL